MAFYKVIFEYTFLHYYSVECIVLGIAILICGIVITVIRANRWKKKNKEKYLDSYDVMQQEKENRENQKFSEIKPVLLGILDAFENDRQIQINTLSSKAELFTKEHQHINVDTIELVNKAIKDVADFADEIKAEQKKADERLSALKKQLKDLGVEKYYEEEIMQTAARENAVVINIVNQLLNHCRDNENLLLQEKIKLLQQ